jgi:hypothetical protein
MLSNPVATTIPKWRTIRLMMWIQNLNQSTWDHKSYVHRPSKDKQLVIIKIGEEGKIQKWRAVEL